MVRDRVSKAVSVTFISSWCVYPLSLTLFSPATTTTRLTETRKSATPMILTRFSLLQTNSNVEREPWIGSGKGLRQQCQRLTDSGAESPFASGRVFSSRWGIPLNFYQRKVASLHLQTASPTGDWIFETLIKETVNWSIGCRDVISNIALELHLLLLG